MAKDIEAVILGDIRDMAQRIVLDEEQVKEDYLRHNAELVDKSIRSAKKTLQTKQKRLEELSRLIQVAYEDQVKGHKPEERFVAFANIVLNCF